MRFLLQWFHLIEIKFRMRDWNHVPLPMEDRCIFDMDTRMNGKSNGKHKTQNTQSNIK